MDEKEPIEPADAGLRPPSGVNEVVAGLLGSIAVANASNAGDQSAHVEELRDTVLGISSGGTAPTEDQQTAAWLELKAMERGAEIPSLNSAAAALVGLTAAITAIFTGVGFATGDFIRMIRDVPAAGLAFLVLAGVTLLVGTFAFVIDAYKSNLNLWIERIAVYSGIVCGAAAFVIAAWGLSQGASAAATRPTISAQFQGSNPPTLAVEVKSSDVPRSENLTTTIWGSSSGTWTVLSHTVSGPQHDGSIDNSIPIGTLSGYDELAVEAFLSSGDTAVPLHPPKTCMLPTATTSAQATKSAVRLVSTPLPGPSDTPPPSCVVLKDSPASTTTSTSVGG